MKQIPTIVADFTLLNMVVRRNANIIIDRENKYMMRNTNQIAWSSSKSSRLTKTASMVEVNSVLAAYIKNQESQKTESWSPIIFKLSLILFSFSNTTRLNKGRRNSDIAIVSNRRKTMARKPPAFVTSCFLSAVLIICRATGGEAGLW